MLRLSTILYTVAVFAIANGYRNEWSNGKQPLVIPSDRCFDQQTNKYYSNATSCENEMGDENCERFEDVITPAAPGTSSTPAVAKDWKPNKELCESGYFYKAANKCRKSCKTCCEHDRFKTCEDDQFTNNTFKCKDVATDAKVTAGLRTAATTGGTQPPPHTVNLCGVRELRDIMLFACPKSCGLCDIRNAKGKMTVAQRHIDAARSRATGGSGGSARQKKLIDPSKLKINRQRNCRDKPPGKAKDKKYYCKARRYRCYEGRKIRQTQRMCPETCALCLSPGFKCKDLAGDEEKCKRWKTRQFCLDEAFSLAIKLHHCSETCGMCDGYRP
ncbi:hypothetical protein DdX_10189 [Ditylenchus destructor]|uniref:ShKT domain-containing protein n=1 Tax=Ditylenchus destructor TaxID=166010 RepID=A0AAD4N2A0_9BILA|nr:hypothetical protein DdX_10189 [Ditylenchus destructor]